MTRRLLLGLAAALLLPAPGAAQSAPDHRLEIAGHLGAGYARSDSWASNAFGEAHDTVPALELVGGGSLSYIPFRPDLLRLQAAADYGQSQVSATSIKTKLQNLTYQGSVQAFTDFPLALDAGASRVRSDFTNNLGGGGTGVTTTDAQRAALLFRLPDLPVLNASYQRAESENQVRGLPDTRGGTETLGVGLNHSLSALTYGVKYDTAWSHGDYVDSAYRSHQLGVQVAARPADNLTLDLTESWFQRDPTRQLPGNPRFETNFLNVAGQWRDEGRTYLSAYLSDTRSDFRNPGDPDRSFRAQGVSQSLQHKVLPQWWLLQGLSLSRTTEQEALSQNSGVGANASGGARWVRDSADQHLQIEGALTLGGLKPDTGAAQLAWGVRGDVNATFPGLARRWQASYGFTYGDNTAGREATIFTQEGRLVFDLLAGGRMNAVGRLQGTQTITDSPLFGRVESRQLQLQADARLWLLELSALGGVAYGATDSFAPSAIPGAEPISASLRATSSFVQLTTGATLWRSLRGQVLLSWRATDTPGQGNRAEQGVALQLGYTIGAFLFTVEDRLTASTVGGSSSRFNYFFVRATRSFSLGI